MTSPSSAFSYRHSIYTARFMHNDKEKRVKILAKTQIGADKIDKIVTAIIQEIQEAQTELKNVTITHVGERVIHYQLEGGEEKRIDIPAEVPSAEGLKISHFPIHHIRSTRALPSFSTSLSHVILGHPWLLVLPVAGWIAALIWARVAQSRYETEIPLTPEELGAGRLGEEPSHFYQLMTLIANDAESQTTPNMDIAQQTRHCAQKGREIQEALHEKNPSLMLQELSKKYAQEILTLQDNTSLLIPLGYYRDGHYHPLLLSFSNKNGQLTAETINLDPALGRKILPIRLYSLQNPTESSITGMLNSLLQFQKRPEQETEAREEGAIKVIRSFIAIDEGGVQTAQDKLTTDQRDISQLIHDLIAKTATEEKLPEELKECVSSSDDWSKSIFIWLEHHHPNAIKKDQRLAWESNLLFNYIDSTLSALKKEGRLTPQQKAHHLLLIEKMIVRLKDRYQKEFGDPQAFDTIWGVHEQARTHLQSIQNEISTIRKDLADHHFIALNQSSSKSKWSTSFPNKVTPPVQALPSSSSFIQELDSNPSVALQQLQAEISHCTTHFNHKEYRDLIDKVDAILQSLPPPTDEFWTNVPDNDIEVWSEQITLLTQYLWESHLKLAYSTLWPHQALNLMNGRCILTVLTERRIKNIKEQFLSALPQEESSTLTGFKALFTNNTPTLKGFTSDIISANSYLIGKLAKELGLSKKEVAILALDGYAFDFKQIDYLLHHHPYLRFGHNPDMEAKCLEIKKFYNQRTGCKAIYLDSYNWKDNWRMYDTDFLYTCLTLSEGYSNKSQSTDYLPCEELWKSSWQRDPQKMQGLPDLAIDLRRHTLFSHTLLHPESTRIKGVGGGMQAQFSLGLWMMNLLNQTVSENPEASQEELLSLAYEKHQEEERKTLAEMGHLELTSGSSGEPPPTPCAQITDHNKKKRIEYKPTGPEFLDARKPLHDAPILGKSTTIPLEWITSTVSAEDGQEVLQERERNQKVSQPQTEFSTLVEEKNADPQLGLSDTVRYKLRTLVSEQNSLACFNACDFILNYTESLESEEVQRLLELTLTRSFLLKEALEKNPEYFASFSKQLKEKCEQAIQKNLSVTALFLIYTGTLLKLHQPQNTSAPTLASDFRISQDSSKSGRELVKKWIDESDSIPVKKIGYTHLLWHYKQQDKLSLEVEEWAPLLHAYIFMKNVGIDAGNHTLQRELLLWVNQKLLPTFNNLSPDIRSQVLSTLTQTEGADWNPDPKNPNIYSSHNRLIHLGNGLIQVNQNPQLFETTLPKEVVQHPAYKRIFGNSTFPVTSFPIQRRGREGVVYNFEKDGHRFHIEQDSRSQNIEIFMKHGTQLLRFQELPSVQGEENFLTNYGLWQDVNHPKRAIVILSSSQTNWTEKDILNLSLIKEGEQWTLSSCITPLGMEVYSDHDGTYSALFGFADPKETLFLRKRGEKEVSEVRFLDKGLTLTRERDGRWKAHGPWQEEYYLVQDPERIRALSDQLGNSFYQCVLPLESRNERTGIRKTQCFLFPVRVTPTGTRETFYSFNIDHDAHSLKLPATTLTIESGKTGAQDGQLQGTTAGFLNLAYQAYVAKDYERALLFLKRAEKETSGFPPQERSYFEQIATYLHEHQDLSLRGIAFKLKAEIAIRNIQRDQLGLKTFRPISWTMHLQKIRHDVKLYKDYQDRVKRGTQKNNLLGPNLQLTAEEIREFDALILESLQFLVAHPAEKSQIQHLAPLSYKPQEISDSLLREFSTELTHYMKPPAACQKLEALSPYVNERDFISNFLGYGQEIRDKKLKTTDWRIQQLENLVLTGLSPQEATYVEVGRQFLIQLAKFNDLSLLDETTPFKQKFQEKLSQQSEAYPTMFKQSLQNLKFGIAPHLIKQANTLIQSALHKERLSLWQAFLIGLRYIISELCHRLFKCCEKALRPGDIYDEVYQSLRRIQEVHNLSYKIEQQLVPPAEKPTPKDEFSTSLSTLKKVLAEEDSFFSSEEKTVWQGIVDHLEAKKQPEDEDRSIVEVLQMCVQAGVHTPSMRHEAESIKEVHQLEKALEKNQSLDQIPEEKPSSIFIDLRRERDFSSEPTAFFDRITSEELFERSQEQKTPVSSKVEDLYSQNTADEMEKQENAYISQGIELAAEAKNKEVKANRGIVRSDQLQNLETEVFNRYQRNKKLLEQLKIEIFSLLKEKAPQIPALQPLFEREGLYTPADIFERALDLYQTHQFSEYPELDGLISRYLLDVIAPQQLVKALDSIDQLKELVEEEKVASIEWQEESRTLLSLLTLSTQQNRYIDKNNNTLVNPQFARKHLVAEYRSEKVAREYQPKIVETMVNKKNQLVLLPPGAGKSKWILPETALLEAEKNKLPIILVTEELLHINRQDMDRSTRELFRQASHIFDFNRKTPKDTAYLIDEYNRLLKVRASHGYLISTIGSMAALDNEIVLVSQEMVGAFTEFERYLDTFQPSDEHPIYEDLRFKELYRSLISFQKQKHWLMKMRGLLQEPSTQYIADEVDTIFNINQDYIYSVGDKRPPNQTISQTMHCIMSTVLSATEGGLAELKQHIFDNTQETLTLAPQKIDTYMEQIAEKIYDQENAFDIPEWSTIQEAIPKDEFIAFVTGKAKESPISAAMVAQAVYQQEDAFGFGGDRWKTIKKKMSQEEFIELIVNGTSPAMLLEQEVQMMKEADLASYCPLKYVGALKHLLSSTLKNCLSGNKAESHYGLSSDGYTVVPQVAGRETAGVRFGDEHELIAYNYLYFAAKAPSQDYFESQWRKQHSLILSQEATPEWSQWYRGAQVGQLTPKAQRNQLYERLQNSKQSWKVRLDLVAHDLLQEKIKRFSSQVGCNSQDPLANANVMGVSGTMNEYALPDQFERDESVYSREVMGKTLLILAEENGMGLDKPVLVYSDGLELIQERANDLNCKTLINQGAALESQDALQILTQLRNNQNQRQFLFVHPQERKQWMWNPQETSPKPYDGSKLDENCFVYFGPADIRGTDWVIPPGEGALIVGAATTDDEFLQSIWRMRRLGVGQEVKIYIHESVQQALQSSLGLSQEPTLANLMKSVQQRTLDHNAQNNYKASSKKIQNPLPQTMKQTLFSPYIEDETTYWASKDEEQLIDVFKDIATDVHLFKAAQKLFIQSREIHFDADLQLSQEKATLLHLQEQYTKQISSVKALEERIGQAHENVKETFKKLCKALDPHGGEILETEIEEQLASSSKRIDSIQEALEGLKISFEESQKKFIQDEEIHRAHLKPNTLILAQADSANSHVHVQEEEEQQMQQQQMVQATLKKTSSDKSIKKEHFWMPWTTTLATIYQNLQKHHLSIAGISLLDCGFSERLHATGNYKDLWKEATIREGDLMGRFACVENKDGKKEFLLIDQLDYEKVLRSTIRGNANENTPAVSVYSLSTQPAKEIEASYRAIDTTQKKPKINKDFYSHLVQIKLVAGHIHFTSDQEKEALREWITSLSDGQKANLKLFIAKGRGVDGVPQIPGWSRSVLAQFLN